MVTVQHPANRTEEGDRMCFPKEVGQVLDTWMTREGWTSGKLCLCVANPVLHWNELDHDSPRPRDAMCHIHMNSSSNRACAVCAHMETVEGNPGRWLERQGEKEGESR